jgi:hypothetical protein
MCETISIVLVGAWTETETPARRSWQMRLYFLVDARLFTVFITSRAVVTTIRWRCYSDDCLWMNHGSDAGTIWPLSNALAHRYWLNVEKVPDSGARRTLAIIRCDQFRMGENVAFCRQMRWKQNRKTRVEAKLPNQSSCQDTVMEKALLACSLYKEHLAKYRLTSW